MAFDDKEMFNCHSPDNDVMCKDCKHRIGNTLFSNDYHKISCQIFEWPKTKPIGILVSHDDCEYYEKEE